MKIQMNLEKKQWLSLLTNDTRLIAIFFTVVSALIVIRTNDIINRDGILYIKAAQAFLNSGIKGVLEVYKWPFYPILIAIISRIFFISLEHSAYLLNIIFSCIIVWSFVSIIKEMKPSSKLIPIISMIVIIGHPRFHHFQKYITRDLGYWAFLMLSLYFIVRFSLTNGWIHVILGWICLDLATLFRLEGIVYLTLYPFIILVREEPLLKKVKKILFLYAIRVVILSLLGLIFHIKGINLYSSTRLKELALHIDYLHRFFLNRISEKGELAGRIILPKPSRKWGQTLVTFGLMGIFISKLIRTVWPLHFLIAAYSFVKKLIPKNRAKAIIYTFLVINLIIPAFFLYENLFLSYRFLMPASFLILILVPFSIEQLWNNLQRSRHVLPKIFNFTVILAFFVLFVCAFKPSKHSKLYIKKTALWLKTHANKGTPVYSNAYIPELSFYSKRPVILLRNLKKIPEKGYLILFREKCPFHMNEKHLKLMASFGSKNKKALVYKVNFP